MSSKKGEEAYFVVEVLPRDRFVSVVTRKMGPHRLIGGHLKDGTWGTHQWFISKDVSFISDEGVLASEDDYVNQILNSLGGELEHRTGDLFEWRSHRGLQSAKKGLKVSDMYFRNYSDYEKYFENLSQCRCD